MMTAMLFKLILYALGIIPLPNLYVTWLEHNSPMVVTAMWKGTMAKETVYHLLRIFRSQSMYGFLHPGRMVRG